MHLCVLCGSQNKQRLFPYTALTYRFLKTQAESVYCAVRTGSLNQTDTVSYLKGYTVRLVTISNALSRFPEFKHVCHKSCG